MNKFISEVHPEGDFSGNAPERLKALTELFHLVTEITNDCLWEWNFKAEEIFWIDGGHKKLFGYEVENSLIPQRFWEECIHPEDKVGVLASLSTVIDKYVTKWEARYRFKSVNGNYINVQDRGHIVYDQDLCAIRMICATQAASSTILTSEKLEIEREIIIE